MKLQKNFDVLLRSSSFQQPGEINKGSSENGGCFH